MVFIYWRMHDDGCDQHGPQKLVEPLDYLILT